MIPISDENPTLRTPVMTWLILGTIFAVWLVVQGAGMDGPVLARTVCTYGLIPGELTGRAPAGEWVPLGHGLACVIQPELITYATPLLSMFMHGSWGHVLGNAIFFWVFGNNVEDSMGALRFLVFYVVCGLAAAAAHVLVQPGSPVPTVGASGAVSGALGAYLVLYPRVRVNMFFLIIIIPKVIPLPAWLVLIWWFAVQVIMGLPELSPVRPDVSGGIAVWAHIGGFLAGAVLIRAFVRREFVAERNELRLARTHWR